MKNKYILKKLVLGSFYVAALLGLSSCDPLGIEPTTKVDVDRFWENAQLSRSYVNNFYTWVPAATGDKFQAEQWSDNCLGNSEKDWTTYRQLQFNARQYDAMKGADCFSAPWAGAYTNVRAVNIGIERISGSTVLRKEIQDQLLAECYFFRAFAYFDLEKYWGAVPYVDKMLTVNDETYLPRTKRETLFDNMLADLNKSIEYFDSFGGTPQLGMINKNTVIAFKSRIALYAACAAQASANGLYSYDDPQGLFSFEKTAQHYYEIAYEAAGSLIGKYSLEPDYATLFTSESAHKSVEAIWPVMFNLNNRSGFNPSGVNGPDGAYYGNNEKESYSWDFRSGLFPTQDLVDCYLQKDEADGKWKNWWETKQAKDLGITRNADGEITGTGVDYRKMYENRDKRFYATVTYDGSYMGPDQEKYQIQTWIDNSDDNDVYKYSALHSGFRSTMKLNAPIDRASAQTITGYYSRKYSHFDMYNESNGTFKKDQRSTCYFNIRYAEVLLNYAEAIIRLNKSGADTYINLIRNRAGLNDFNEKEAVHDLWEELKLQRRLEFAFECPGFRYFDLIRWGEAEGKIIIEELNKESRGILIFRKGIESEKAGKNGYPAAPSDKGYFTPHFETKVLDYSYYERKFDHQRYYFMPFDETTLADYHQLGQNPGWKDFRYNN